MAVINSLYSRGGGPIPKFKDYHIWKALQCIYTHGPVGRKRISLDLNIGEGSTRTVLTLLQDEGVLIINKSGVVLTDKGMDLWKSVLMEVGHSKMEGLTIGEHDCIVRIPGKASSVKDGCKERDIAIIAGATGATTLVYRQGKVKFPDSDSAVDAATEDAIRKAFNLREEDLIIVGTGRSEYLAELGAVSAGLESIGGLKIRRESRKEPRFGLESRSSNNELIALAFAIHDLVGGLPVCAKSHDNLGIRIESGSVIDNAYTGAVLEEVLIAGTTIRKIALSGPYKGIRVIVTPVELDNKVIAAIGVVDIRSMAGVDNLIRLRSDDDE